MCTIAAAAARPGPSAIRTAPTSSLSPCCREGAAHTLPPISCACPTPLGPALPLDALGGVARMLRKGSPVTPVLEY